MDLAHACSILNLPGSANRVSKFPQNYQEKKKKTKLEIINLA